MAQFDDWQKFSFANLKWRSTPTLTKSFLESRGYIYQGITDLGELQFGGSIFNARCGVLCDFTAHGELESVLLGLECGTVKTAKRLFESVLHDLSAKYGAPWNVTRNYFESYIEGGPNEADGFRSNAIIFGARWQNNTHEGDESIHLCINPRLDVHVMYAFDDWSALESEGDL